MKSPKLTFMSQAKRRYPFITNSLADIRPGEVFEYVTDDPNPPRYLMVGFCGRVKEVKDNTVLRLNVGSSCLGSPTGGGSTAFEFGHLGGLGYWEVRVVGWVAEVIISTESEN